MNNQTTQSNKRRTGKVIVPTWAGALCLVLIAVIVFLAFGNKIDSIDSGPTGAGTAFQEYKMALENVIAEYGSIGDFMQANDNNAVALQNQINNYADIYCRMHCTEPVGGFEEDGDILDRTAVVVLYATPTYHNMRRYILYYHSTPNGGSVTIVAAGNDDRFATAYNETTGLYEAPDGSDDLVMTVDGQTGQVSLQGFDNSETLEINSGHKLPDDIILPEKKNILTVENKLALSWHNYADKAARKIIRNNDNYHFAVNADDKNIDLNLLLSLDQFDVVIWIGHGLTEGKIGTCIQTGISAPASVAIDTNGQLIDIGGLCCISSKFIYENFDEDSFDGQIFFIGCCNPEKNYDLPEALLSKGAACVFVFSGTVGTKYDDQMCVSIFEEMAKGKTAGEALKAAQDKYGEYDPANSATKLRIFGNENIIL